jgi:hypothetical protein
LDLKRRHLYERFRTRSKYQYSTLVDLRDTEAFQDFKKIEDLGSRKPVVRMLKDVRQHVISRTKDKVKAVREAADLELDFVVEIHLKSSLRSPGVGETIQRVRFKCS